MSLQDNKHSKAFEEEVATFLKRYDTIEVVEVLLADMNGIFRMKQGGIGLLHRIAKGSFVLSSSVSYMTTTGETAACTFEEFGADPDRPCVAIPSTLTIVPWAKRPTAQVVVRMLETDDTPWFTDPYGILASVNDRLYARGLIPVVAMEYEFYLFEKGGPPLKTVAPLNGMVRSDGINYMSAEIQADFAPILNEIEQACHVQNIPVDTILCEYGEGQFEVNLHHGNDVLKACSDALLLKRVIKNVALKHDLLASFMAKPQATQSGSGLHAHVSLLNKAGDNVFGLEDGEQTLSHAVGGILATMHGATAVFAPNANSYRRFDPELYTPIVPNWGENNRRVSVRLPVADAKNRRFEHRVSGADACPYLVMAAILAGVDYGLEQGCDPGPKLDEYDGFDRVNTLPQRWHQALDAFKTSDVMKEYLGEGFHKLYFEVRSEEEENYHRMISDNDYSWYLRVI